MTGMGMTPEAQSNAPAPTRLALNFMAFGPIDRGETTLNGASVFLRPLLKS